MAQYHSAIHTLEHVAALTHLHKRSLGFHSQLENAWRYQAPQLFALSTEMDDHSRTLILLHMKSLRGLNDPSPCGCRHEGITFRSVAPYPSCTNQAVTDSCSSCFVCFPYSFVPVFVSPAGGHSNWLGRLRNKWEFLCSRLVDGDS